MADRKVTTRFGRFTAKGSQEVERLIADQVDEISETILPLLPPQGYRAVVMLGGYGRGEGGVEFNDGRERPHNNYDFLIITHDLRSSQQQELHRQLSEAVAPLIEKFGLGIDMGVISDQKLLAAPCLVMWYDMRHGHKTVLGDDDFVPSLEQFTLENVLPVDIRNLLVNRSTLLIINRLLISNASSDDLITRKVVKHSVKAIIGYGDALLFFAGKYDWSYITKQQRMRSSELISPEFRDSYDKAMEFRFRPDYTNYSNIALEGYNNCLLKQLEPIHLKCESERLSAGDLTWKSYLDTALRVQLGEGLPRPRALARKVLATLHRNVSPKHLSLKARLGLQCSHPKEYLPLLCPAVSYDLDDTQYRHAVSTLLRCSTTDLPALTRHYLRAWGKYGDPNFEHAIKEFGADVSVDEDE